MKFQKWVNKDILNGQNRVVDGTHQQIQVITAHWHQLKLSSPRSSFVKRLKATARDDHNTEKQKHLPKGCEERETVRRGAGARKSSLKRNLSFEPRRTQYLDWGCALARSRKYIYCCGTPRALMFTITRPASHRQMFLSPRRSATPRISPEFGTTPSNHENPLRLRGSTEQCTTGTRCRASFRREWLWRGWRWEWEGKDVDSALCEKWSRLKEFGGIRVFRCSPLITLHCICVFMFKGWNHPSTLMRWNTKDNLKLTQRFLSNSV